MTAEATIERGVGAQRTARPTLQWTEHPLIDLDERFRRLSDVEFMELCDAAGEEAALAYFSAREKRIKDSERDPFKYEFRLPHWDDVEDMVRRKLVTFVPGGNNPGKSWWAGSLVMRFLTRQFQWENMSKGKLQVLMVSQDDDASQMFQQPAVYAHFPVEWRAMNESSLKAKGFAKQINYGEKNGFTEGNFVLPRPLKGQCWFKTVAQYTREPKSFEGPAYDLVIIDEGCPLPLLKALIGRAAKRGGRVIYLLTCVHGYDQAMGQGLDGATITKTLPLQWDWLAGGVNTGLQFPELKIGEHQTDGLRKRKVPAGHLPYTMQPLNPNWGVIFMWNHWNPFQPFSKWVPPRPAPSGAPPNGGHAWWGQGRLPAQFDAAVGEPRWKALVRLFGWIEKLGQLAIGNFNPEVHVASPEVAAKLDAMIREGKATVYVGDDPETQRSHAILWQATFPPSPQYPRGLKYLFDESPRMNEGEWVNANGDKGDGQFVYKATGANWYKRYIRERERSWNLYCPMEHREEDKVEGLHPCVALRHGDPRGFASEESTATGTRSMFNLYLEDHSNEHPDLKPLLWLPAKIRRATMLDLDLLIDLYRYDDERALAEGGLTAENTPARLVSPRCENYIRCVLNYTLTDLGKKEEDNPYADFIDADRYLNASDTPFVEMARAQESGGGSWG